MQIKFKLLLFFFYTTCYFFFSGPSQAAINMKKSTTTHFIPTQNNELAAMKLKLFQVGEPVLRNEARTLTKEEILSPSIQQFIELMKITLRDAPGVGLAAPQVGVPIQLAVIEDREEYLKNLTSEEIMQRDRHPVPFHVIINPKITILTTGPFVEFYEGCLSLTGFVGKVSRALTVKVEALNEKGEPVTIQANGWYARILQHEIDHLHGKLYIDRMIPTTFSTIENYKKFPVT